MPNTVLLVAFALDTDAQRETAERSLMNLLPRPGADLAAGGQLECWWIAEDDRHDGSDNDSAVFVHPGAAEAAFRLLHAVGLTAAHNQPAVASLGSFEPPEADPLERLRGLQAGLDDASDPRILDWAVGVLDAMLGRRAGWYVWSPTGDPIDGPYAEEQQALDEAEALEADGTTCNVIFHPGR